MSTKGARSKRKKDLRATIASNAQGDQVLIKFSQSVIIAAFDPKTAMELGQALQRAAGDLIAKEG